MSIKINSTLFDSLSSDLETDLEAMFNLMKDDILLLGEKAMREGWTPEQLLDAIDVLFE